MPTNLIVAAAVDSSGNLTPVSSWGPVHVDLGAYSNDQGYTSYSAGYTSGVAGVIAALLPPDHSAQDVKNVILQTVTPHAQSVGAWCTSGGVINPAGAVALVMSQGVSIDAGGQRRRRLQRRRLLQRRQHLLREPADRHQRRGQPRPPAGLPDRAVRQFHLHDSPSRAGLSLHCPA